MILIDGYNLLFKIFKEPLDIKTKCDELLGMLSAYSLRCSKSVTVYLDKRSNPSVVSQSCKRGQLRIYYPRSGQSADDAIIEEILNVRDKTSITVVSSDRSIISPAMKKGVKCIRSEDFARDLLRVTAKEVQEKRVSGISKEEAKHWFKEFGLSDDLIRDLNKRR